MKIHRFIGNYIFSDTKLSLRDPKLIKQIRQVLRLKIGARLIIGNGRGEEATTELVKIKPTEIELKILNIRPVETEEKRRVHLFCAVLKKENFEQVIQKATEIGVAEITPIITERTVKTGLNYDRLQKIIKEAAEQSGRGFLPRLNDSLDFPGAITTPDGQQKILFHPAGESLAEISREPVAIYIGPEGGFTPSEVALARAQGASIASLGSLVFRAETAAIIASYLASRI